ncbi:MAG: hypothetical protein ACYTAN_10305 [Planctomycetota bacterium]|jgi:hypothetical protein
MRTAWHTETGEYLDRGDSVVSNDPDVFQAHVAARYGIPAAFVLVTACPHPDPQLRECKEGAFPYVPEKVAARDAAEGQMALEATARAELQTKIDAGTATAPEICAYLKGGV